MKLLRKWRACLSGKSFAMTREELVAVNRLLTNRSEETTQLVHGRRLCDPLPRRKKGG